MEQFYACSKKQRKNYEQPCNKSLVYKAQCVLKSFKSSHLVHCVLVDYFGKTVSPVFGVVVVFEKNKRTRLLRHFCKEYFTVTLSVTLLGLLHNCCLLLSDV